MNNAPEKTTPHHSISMRSLTNQADALPQLGTNFVDVVVADLAPYLDAFDPVESLLVLNELQRRLSDLEEEYQAYANWEAEELFAA